MELHVYKWKNTSWISGIWKVPDLDFILTGAYRWLPKDWEEEVGAEQSFIQEQSS